MKKNIIFSPRSAGEEGRAAFLVLWMMGVPVSVLLVLWVIFGNNIFGAG